MKHYRILPLCLTAAMLLPLLLVPQCVAAGSETYYNSNYLESYAAAASAETALGAVWTQTATTWKVWSPTASSVYVRLYKTGSDTETGAGILATRALQKDSTTGIWALTLEGNFKNVYYTYLVTVNGTTRETQDIYAKAAGVNGTRSMVADLASTDPDGWENDAHVYRQSATEAVVWEVHIRDFSISPTSGVTAANRGKFLAFTQSGTTVNGNGSIATCVNYLVSQGINTVQILPFFDFGSVDETVTNDAANRNWGYDPVNYNVPEGSYSSNPYDGNVRITECKEMIQALHRAGISVVMDVVYNHTYNAVSGVTDSAFSRTVPGYYYRMQSATDYYDGSGCGNVTASDKTMFRKFMIDSVTYWAKEYHIDGFRFDLMGCHDITTMNAIRAALDGLYEDGSGQKILMYGEPWSGGNTGISDGCTQAAAAQLSTRVGMFCDTMRDALKGSADGSDAGWIQGATTLTDRVWEGLTASAGTSTDYPSQVVTYADCHDNLCLWDKIVLANGSVAYTDTNAVFSSQLRLAQTILAVSQGMMFIQAGSEFGRTKLGNSNSYNLSDSVNAINWETLENHTTDAAYFRGLLKIRAAFTPFVRAGSKYVVTNLTGCSANVIAFTVPNTASGEWSAAAVLLNNAATVQTVSGLSGTWYLLADGTTAGTTALQTLTSGTYTIPAYGCAILVQAINVSKGIHTVPAQYSGLQACLY